MSFKINSIFTSIQGEGINMGKPAIFIRFSGCNMKPLCEFCDTKHDKVRHDMSAEALFLHIEGLVTQTGIHHIIFTGGEPLLQLLTQDGMKLFEFIKNFNIKTRYVNLTYEVETNGSLEIKADFLSKLKPENIVLSPKVSFENIHIEFDSVKILYPYINEEITAEKFMTTFQFFRGSCFIMGMEGKEGHHNANFKALHEVERLNRVHPYNKKSNLQNQWRLTVQLHKLLSII